jgi:APA family basic amino acid/polyamine antiporter
MSHDKMAALPNTLLLVTLSSNFGTFLLYMLSCFICMVAYHKHPKFNALKHLIIPVFGLAGESGLHGVLSDWTVHGLRQQDGAAAGAGGAGVWAIYGGIYFLRSQQRFGQHDVACRIKSVSASRSLDQDALNKTDHPC